MRKSIIFILSCFIYTISNGQAENFELGKKAYQANEYTSAIRHLTIAVNEEKYEMKGKDLPLAYAYLANIKLMYLESKVNTDDPDKHFLQNITSLYEDINNATDFQSNATETLNTKTKERLEQFIKLSSKSLAQPLLELDRNNYNEDDLNNAKFITGLLSYFQNYQTDPIPISVLNLIGICQFVQGNSKTGITALESAREGYREGEDFVDNSAHLKNHIISHEYYSSEVINSQKSKAVSKSGIELVKKIVNSLDGDDFSIIKKYTIIENKFYYTISKLDE